METTLTAPSIFNYENARANPFKKYIESIKKFRLFVFSALKERGVHMSGSCLLMEEIKRITDLDGKDYYSCNLFPADTKIGSRKIKFLFKENGEIKFSLHVNEKSPSALNPNWREHSIELRESYPKLYESTALWLKSESFTDLFDTIAEFIKEAQ